MRVLRLLHLLCGIVAVYTVVCIQQSIGQRKGKDADAPYRWCFICVSSGPNTTCELDPAAVRDSVNHINCTRPYCTVKRIEHGGDVWSFERGCHVTDYGNQCQSALGGNQRTCHTTCRTSWCNSGPGLPVYRSRKVGDGSKGRGVKSRSCPLSIIITIITVMVMWGWR